MIKMSMTEVVEESLKADTRFRHLTVMTDVNEKIKSMIAEYPESEFPEMDQFIERIWK